LHAAPFPIAFSTLGCPEWTLEQAFSKAEEYGYDGIEVRLLDGEVLALDSIADFERRALPLVRDTGVQVPCVDTSVRVALADSAADVEGAVAELRSFVDVAESIGAVALRVFGGDFDAARIDRDRAVANAGRVLTEVSPYAEEHHVSVLLETHDAFSRSDNVGAALAATDSPAIGAVWDVLHPCRVGEPPSQVMRTLDGRIGHLHVKDGRPPKPGLGRGPSDWELVLLGEGDVPLREIFELLATNHYAGWLSVEWERKWHPELAAPEAALPQHLEVLIALLMGA
jgi:sugar phosphate isomerase/epimerase